ncbi:MAG: FAD-dependent oxidoreductase [bacterium]
MESKIGVYICKGCSIGDSLNIEALSKVATDEYKVAVCKAVDSCEEATIQAIQGEIESEALNKVVFAGCSPRLHNLVDTLAVNGVILERVNLREQVVWCQPPNDEDTQMMAQDYLRMGIVKAKMVEPLEPFEESKNIDKTILVVGGGIAGLTTAIQSAKTGYSVVLVEKEGKLGGWMTKLHKSIPTKPPYRDLEDTGIDDKIREVAEHPKITVYTSTLIEKISGAPGLFDVRLKNTNGANGPVELRVGAIVQATGWRPDEPAHLAHLGYGSIPDVITNVKMEELAKSGRIVRPSDGKPAKRIAFVQVSGSKEEDYFSYSSSICCLTSLKQAVYLREQDSKSKAYVFYDHIRTPGQYEDFYRRVQEDEGVFLTKGEVTAVRQTPDGALALDVKDTMLGKKISVEVDLVVLAAGMVPNSADGEAIRALIDAKAIVAKGEEGVQKDEAVKTIERLKKHEGTAILNLEYRQGPDLPALTQGYPDSHFICFPYETRRTGVYAAGCLRQPMDGVSATEDGTGAALKAIQCVEMTSRGEAAHPRSGDKSYPEFFLQRCTQCKRCTEECPFGVLNEDEKGTPLPNPTRCRRCGVCMGACPERIISFKDYSVSIISSMIKAIEVPDEFDEKPRILAFVCENDAYPAVDLAGRKHLSYSPFVRFIPVRCLGSMNVVWVADALSRGIDAILLIGCKYGDDYQCHFIKGSELADRRGENVREKLKQLVLENERVQLHQLAISEYEKIPTLINDMAETIEEVGMNPFKGM